MRHKCNVKYKFEINYSWHWTDQMLLMLDRMPSMSSSICLSFVFSESTWAWWKISAVLDNIKVCMYKRWSPPPACPPPSAVFELPSPPSLPWPRPRGTCNEQWMCTFQHLNFKHLTLHWHIHMTLWCFNPFVTHHREKCEQFIHKYLNAM